MSLISLSFCLFFIIVFLLYYLPLNKNTKSQNYILLFSSYFFYAFADWRMVPLLLIATVIIYYLGIAISKDTSSKRASFLSTIGVVIGIGLLLYFKYFNFFIEAFSDLFSIFGLKSNIGTFNIIMPLGISFFTFKLISYIVEISRGKIKPTTDFVVFSTYIAFFPTILSGPIDRPNTFIPQLQKKIKFDYLLAVDGCRQILWGLFQKVVIADTLALMIAPIWNDIPNTEASTLVFAALLYSMQLYTDFSGYSHIAIGIGKLLGLNITRNFNYPFFARNISEFWRNWHISLTSWLTDYVFMPLNIKYRNLGNLGITLSIIINFFLVGMWHGANWAYIVFGLFHGLLFIPLIISGAFLKKKKLQLNKYGLPSLLDFSKMIGTYILVTLSFIIFRADNMHEAISYFLGIFSETIFTPPNISKMFAGFALDMTPFFRMIEGWSIMFFIVVFILIEWKGQKFHYAIQNLGMNWKRPFRHMMYYSFIIAILWFIGEERPFVYVQF